VTTVQELLSGGTVDRGEGVRVESDGYTIRPWLELIDAVAGEVVLRGDGDGLQAAGIDAADVSVIRTRLHPEALETYQWNPETDSDATYTAGVDAGRLATVTSVARKGRTTADPLSINWNGTRDATITTEREYCDTTVSRGRTMDLYDPASVEDGLDLWDNFADSSHRDATVSTQALRDVTSDLRDYVTVSTKEGDLHVAVGVGEDSDPTEAARFHDAVEEPADPAESHYSADYLRSIASALHGAKCETVTLCVGEDVPLVIEFKRRTDDGTVVYDGSVAISPRIKG